MTGNTASDDLLRRRIPLHCAFLAIAFYRHPTGDRYPEPHLEWTVCLLSASYAIEKILHVCMGCGRRVTRQRLLFRFIDFLRNEAYLLNPFENTPLVTKNLLSH